MILTNKCIPPSLQPGEGKIGQLSPRNFQ